MKKVAKLPEMLPGPGRLECSKRENTPIIKSMLSKCNKITVIRSFAVYHKLDYD